MAALLICILFIVTISYYLFEVTYLVSCPSLFACSVCCLSLFIFDLISEYKVVLVSEDSKILIFIQAALLAIA